MSQSIHIEADERLLLISLNIGRAQTVSTNSAKPEKTAPVSLSCHIGKYDTVAITGGSTDIAIPNELYNIFLFLLLLCIVGHLLGFKAGLHFGNFFSNVFLEILRQCRAHKNLVKHLYLALGNKLQLLYFL